MSISKVLHQVKRQRIVNVRVSQLQIILQSIVIDYIEQRFTQYKIESIFDALESTMLPTVHGSK